MRHPGHRRTDNPWDEAPDWAIELALGLNVIIENQEKIMAAIDDLKTAIAGLITEATTDINALLAQINAAVNNDPAIVDLTKQASDATAALHSSFTGTTGVALPPVTPPPPA